MDYKKKYLKYKLKYLTAKRLYGGMDGDPKNFPVNLLIGNKEILIEAKFEENIWEAIGKAITNSDEIDNDVKIVSVVFGEEDIENYETFEESGIKEGARLIIELKPITLDDVITDIIYLNSDLTYLLTEDKLIEKKKFT